MAKAVKQAKKESNPAEHDKAEAAIDDGKILDYITGRPVADTDKERVRQRIGRAIIHEYGIAAEDMEPDFRVKIDGRVKKVDLAIFRPGTEHEPENVYRVVVCLKEPSIGTKGAYHMRDPEEADREFELLKGAMVALDNCQYGLWTNGLEFFYFRKEKKRFDTLFNPIGDWPMGDDTIGTREVASLAKMRRADPYMLRVAFRRCHNYIHGNEGMPKDAAFWQFLYLIFCKMYDERLPNDARKFWAGPYEPFDAAGQKAIRGRILPLFQVVKKKHADIFRGNEEITLSDRALAFIVSELSRYDFARTDVDAKGAAYQEIVGTNLRGDRGQFFTPRGAIRLMISMLNPKPKERMLDPACGTGGFLVATLDHIYREFRRDANLASDDESTEEFISVRDRLTAYADAQLFGADFDQFLVRAAQMNVVMAGNSVGNLFNMNSLEFPAGHLGGVEPARNAIPLGSVDVVATNPPFGSDIPITDRNILKNFELAHVWERTEDRGYRNTGRLQNSVAPEVLFIERCIGWLKHGGRMGIVLPDGILGNPATEYIRWWILRHCWVLASVDLPVEVFIVEANVNILTSLLFFKKKTAREIQTEDLGGKADYPVFMAVAEKVGYDRRGNALYKRSSDGEEILKEVEDIEHIRIGGKIITRTLRRKKKIVDDDLLEIAAAYTEFRKKNPEPGK